MARGEIKIPVGVDTSGIQREINNGLVEPIEDAEKALKKLGDTDAGTDLKRDLEKASKATEELGDELDEARKDLKKLGFAAKDAGDDAKRGMKGAEDGIEEFGDEAKSTAKESAASFDGSAESIIDAFQEVAANAFAGFGPAGLLAGLAIAAGIGIAVGEFQKAAEAAEELRMKAVEYAADAVEAGVSTDRWITSAGVLVERIRELEEAKSSDFRAFWDEDPSKLEDWTDGLDKMGRSAEEVGDVLKSSTGAVEDYRDAIEDSRRSILDEMDAITERTAASGEATDADRARYEALQEQLAGSKDVLEALDEELKLRDATTESAQRQSAAGVDAALERADAEEEAAARIEGAQEAVEASALSAYDSMRSAAYDKATADDAAFNVDTWLTYVEETRALADQYKSNLEGMKLTPAEWENFLALPEEARNSIAASYQSAGEEGKERIRVALSDGGSTAGADATVGFDENFNPSAEVEIQAETGAAEADLKDVSRDRTAEIKVKTSGKADAKNDLDALARDRHATINVRADVSRADSAINTMRRNQESRPLYITVYKRNGGDQLV
ncbi:hypothetical protein BMW26_07825 [Microbacterium sp. 1.5R]|uniref:hypothetical protein n=1 Tax=Microbacterium sp. 1.5R TaxID=1916917 RepID=UPI00090B2758|nr:hypothetical protein [Microbacterium sp. 1.5R]APH44874.1 hypothetical protein BMW26_07825 [Microbacterium sp. 1.5R]